MRQDARPAGGHLGEDERALAVPPVRLDDPGGGRRAAATALLALAAVITAAVVLPQLATQRPLPSRVVETAIASLAPPSPSSSIEPFATPSGTLPPPAAVADPGALAAMVRAGGLDGQLVLVDGDLEVIELPCDRAPTVWHTCVLLAIQGLDLPVEAGAPALPWHDDPARGDWLVTVVAGRRLTYLGSLSVSAYEPVSLGDLTRHLLARHLDEPPRTLFAADGWLVVNPPHTCYRRDPEATPCPTPAPFLAADEPLADGTLRSSRGAGVVLADPVGVDPAATVTPGTFLVTLPAASECRAGSITPGCDEGAVRWVLAARYDPREAVLVSIR